MKKKELYIKPVAKKITLEVRSSMLVVQSTYTEDNFSKKKVFDDNEEVEEW